MTRPVDIRVTDLARPALTGAQATAVAFAETQPVQFRVETILAAAVERTGLCGFGKDDFR